MTPQERDLITALLARLQQQAGQPKDAEAETLIRQGMAAQPDAPYLLVQTVLIQDMTLHDTAARIAELERQLAARPAPASAPSFLGGAGRGSVPAAGPWSPAPPAAGAVWTQTPAEASAPPPQPPMTPPQMLSGAGSGFLRQAATTAAGIAGGALLFQGISSLFGPHYGSGFLGGTPMQPGLSETVINNYYGDQQGAAPDQGGLDSAAASGDPGIQSADSGQAFADQDIATADDTDSQDFGDDGNYDV
jgi:hypothetical protein